MLDDLIAEGTAGPDLAMDMAGQPGGRPDRSPPGPCAGMGRVRQGKQIRALPDPAGRARGPERTGLFPVLQIRRRRLLI